MANIIIAGFGGQGVLVLGQLITYAGMIEDKAVSWFPSYGPNNGGEGPAIALWWLVMKKLVRPLSVNLPWLL